jgi:ATP synthase protein I
LRLRRHYGAAEFQQWPVTATGWQGFLAQMSDDGLDDRNRGGDQPAQGGDLSDRLKRLDVALKKARPPSDGKGGALQNSGAAAQGMAQALRMSSEFAAGVIVGAGLGWFFDYVLGTSPWGLIVFLMLGFAAGVLNILRSSALDKGSGSSGG